MYDDNDYIIRDYYSKDGRYKPQRWVMHYCDSCGKKRSYAPKCKTGLCNSCACLGRTISSQQRLSISKKLTGRKIAPRQTADQYKQSTIKASATKAHKSESERQRIVDMAAATRLKVDLDFYINNKDLLRKESKIRRRLAHNLRSQLYNFLMNRGVGLIRNLDYTIEDLRRHLESKFESWMNWDNYGRKPGIECWEIDHIVPINARSNNGEYVWSRSDLSDPQSSGFKRLWALENLQPMSAKENNSKNNKYEVS
jgi:hypothetical protein